MIHDCRILGMDNSTKSTGWAVLDIISGVPVLVDYGLIKRGNKDISDALVEFERVFVKLIKEYKPDYVSAEQMFIGANRTTAMSLGYIHGIMLLNARKYKIPLTYYSVMTAKSVTVGGMQLYDAKGHRKTGMDMKMEVQQKVFEILGKQNFTKEYTDDVTDACSIALTFAYTDGQSTERRAIHNAEGKQSKSSKDIKSKDTKSKVTKSKDTKSKVTKPKVTKSKTTSTTSTKRNKPKTRMASLVSVASKKPQVSLDKLKDSKSKLTVNNLTLFEV